jgi:adenylate kinase
MEKAATDFNVIFLVGPQGSGKGTQGKLLAEKLGFFYWEMGAILREIIHEGGPLAERVSVINQGTLLSDELIIEVIKEKLYTIPLGQGVIFDGIPRRLGQAEFLLGFLKEQKRDTMATLFFDLPREDSIRRLSLRGQKEGRADDTPEGITFRLSQYEEAIKPTLEYLRKETKFIDIDGRPSVEEVAKNIDATLGI